MARALLALFKAQGRPPTPDPTKFSEINAGKYPRIAALLHKQQDGCTFKFKLGRGGELLCVRDIPGDNNDCGLNAIGNKHPAADRVWVAET